MCPLALLALGCHPVWSFILSLTEQAFPSYTGMVTLLGAPRTDICFERNVYKSLFSVLSAAWLRMHHQCFFSCKWKLHPRADTASFGAWISCPFTHFLDILSLIDPYGFLLISLRSNWIFFLTTLESQFSFCKIGPDIDHPESMGTGTDCKWCLGSHWGPEQVFGGGCVLS